MHVTFLEAANGTRLSKRHCPKNGFTPYPNVKRVNSFKEDIPLDSTGLAMLEQQLLTNARKGRCLLKGNLKKDLQAESRAGKTDRQAYSSLLILDIDNLSIKDHITPQVFTNEDVSKLAKQVLRELPKEVQETSFIAQASASLGLKGNNVSLHIFMFLTYAMPASTIKLWLQNCNFESELFASQLELSANGHSLKYPLDISVADNSKLIFIAPPTFEDNAYDPFKEDYERIVRVPNTYDTLDLAHLMSDISPEIVRTKTLDAKNELRRTLGFNRKTERLIISNVDNRTEEILTNPDRMSISIATDTYTPFICCNVNGGDSGAYYFNLKDPTYMYNFKGEPIWLIEKADPEFYKEIFDHYSKELEMQGRATYPVVLRDFKTDTVYNGLFDPNLNQFNEDFPLTPCGASSVPGFMRSHGRTEPDFIPDARVIFDPLTKETAVNLTTIPYYVNIFQSTTYMRDDTKMTPIKMGQSAKISEACPLIYKLINHIVGGRSVETEYFINWLAFIFQTNKKTGTAWLLQGVPGTGKGIFYTKILRPLFGQQHVPMRALQSIEEQFNLYMREALFLIVDEFHMASANAGTIKIADKLKSMITEPTLTIRAMRTNQIEVPNFTNLIFYTNRNDAAAVEEGDRRYNIGVRQEQKLEAVYPEVIENIDKLENELSTFATILRNFVVNKRLVHTPMSNDAKAQMAHITMSVLEEFFAAVKHGTLEFFIDVLDIELTNVMQGQAISTAQRIVKQWVIETKYPYSVVPMEHLRTVHNVLTENPMSIRDFQKKAERCGLTPQRKREHTSTGTARGAAPRGFVTTWKVDQGRFEEIINRYFTSDADQKLLAHASSSV